MIKNNLAFLIQLFIFNTLFSQTTNFPIKYEWLSNDIFSIRTICKTSLMLIFPINEA